MKRYITATAIVALSFLMASCTANKTATTPLDQEKALAYVQETKELLMGTLMKKIKENGTENALEFCNINALPLTKSVAVKHQTQIKRVSDKNRNPQNKANAQEIALINRYKAQLLEGKEVGAVMKDHQLYVPIVTNSQCLKCHGVAGETIELKTAEKLKKLYPNDLATGYKVNEIRGLFVVSSK